MRALLLTGLVAAFLGIATPWAPVQALPISLMTFNFDGTCDGCQGSAHAELLLNNYTPGDTITTANFVSLHYDPTPSIPAGFTILPSSNLKVGGSIGPLLPETEYVYVIGTMTDGNDQAFETFKNGLWCTGLSCIDVYDSASSHLWSDPEAVAVPVPEPASLALLVLPLGVARLVAKRRRELNPA